MKAIGVRFPYSLPTNMKFLCKIGIHDPEWDQIWYYSPESHCTRCNKENVLSLRERYIWWAQVHTMNPFAWPFVIYASITYWWYDRKYNDDGSPKKK